LTLKRYCLLGAIVGERAITILFNDAFQRPNSSELGESWAEFNQVTSGGTNWASTQIDNQSVAFEFTRTTLGNDLWYFLAISHQLAQPVSTFPITISFDFTPTLDARTDYFVGLMSSGGLQVPSTIGDAATPFDGIALEFGRSSSLFANSGINFAYFSDGDATSTPNQSLPFQINPTGSYHFDFTINADDDVLVTVANNTDPTQTFTTGISLPPLNLALTQLFISDITAFSSATTGLVTQVAHFDNVQVVETIFTPTFADARIVNQVDSDGDGYASSFRIEFDVDSNVAGNYYVKLWEDDLIFGDFLTQSPTFAVNGTSIDYQGVAINTDIFPDVLNLGTAEFRLDLYDASTNGLKQTWAASNDTNLGKVRVELSNQDAVGIFGQVSNGFETFNVSIQRDDAFGQAINPALRTWIVIHGRNSSANDQNIQAVADAIHQELARQKQTYARIRQKSMTWQPHPIQGSRELAVRRLGSARPCAGGATCRPDRGSEGVTVVRSRERGASAAGVLRARGTR